jgi:RNA polymerase sigma-54 factor
MALNARLEMRQGQGLVITPQLQQAIKLLQLSNLELDAYVDAELEKNPLLAREEPAADAAEPDAPLPEASDSLAFDEHAGGAASREIDAAAPDIYDASPGERAAGDGCEAPDAGFQASTPGAADAGGAIDWSKAGSGGTYDGDDSGLERALAREPTLHEHLDAQITAAGFTATERLIAGVLLDAVDEGGYLRLDVVECAARLGCDQGVVERVLARCQGFEPVGVFARSVSECLRLQLQDRDRCDPAMDALLGNLELLAKRDLVGLRRICGVDDEDLREMIAEVKACTPRPGASFGAEPPAAVIPDVFVREDPLGGWKVELNADTLPRLLVDQRYHAQVSRGAKTDADKVFVADCFAQASWLVKSLDQRARTILKVTAEIVRQQDSFLAFGVEHLRPLNLKHVADAIGMHESTVSRVTSNKYVATPRGLFELKFFFTSAISATGGGEAHSAEAVRHRIKTLIDGEAGRSDGEVLSDDQIVETLREGGVEIARRTVAKYREALRIPSSVERKRQLRAAC